MHHHKNVSLFRKTALFLPHPLRHLQLLHFHRKSPYLLRKKTYHVSHHTTLRSVLCNISENDAQ